MPRIAVVGATGAVGHVMIDLLPDSNQKFREITAQYLRQTAESDIKPQLFYVDLKKLQGKWVVDGWEPRSSPVVPSDSSGNSG